MNYLKNEITDQTVIGLIILIISLLMGVAGIFLFNSKAWGINVTLFSLLLIAFILIVRNLAHLYVGYREYTLMASGVFFALALTWRDSLVLNSLSYLGLMLTISLAFNTATRPKLRYLEISQIFQDFLLSIEYGISSYRDLIREDIHWNEVKNHWGDNINSILRGLMVTTPMLLVFGLLLIASDARFEQAVFNSLNWELNEESVLRFGAIFIICCWFSIAILRGTIFVNSINKNVEKLYLPIWRLGCIETGITLGAVNLLFLSFIIIQFTYFFGGDALIQSLDGPTYSNYARRGFIQLVAVTLLVIILLLFTHWLYQPYNKFERRLYQLLSVIMIIMTMIIAASAAHRMYLYTSVYGFTELRFYTSIFMLWLIILFVWFSLTVLHGKRTQFIFGAIVSGMFFIALLHIINPDAQITKFNFARLQAQQRFDAAYLSSLSTDAVPTILANLPYIEEKQRCQLWTSLNKLPVLQTKKDWRAFNLSQHHAQQLWLEQSELNCGQI
ncbi:DUF4173 domain-containing protein [Candidatus Halobeggiatoa sp. HSG11]|nr:DUF4173 domain-containing protein [Candidatus Halobeggiatoa sp. HSG11]